MKFKKAILRSITILSVICFVTGCSEKELETKPNEEVKGNCTIIECMKKIEVTNTMEEINAIIGFESTVDAMIGSDPIWKFDSKNWITLKTYENDQTIQATIDKETIKDENIKLPTQKELQALLNKGITYEELVEQLGGEGTLSTISKGSTSYTWADKNGQRLGATFNNESKKCTVASYR